MRISLAVKLTAIALAAILSPVARAADYCESRKAFTPAETGQIQDLIALSVPVPDVEAAKRMVVDIEPGAAFGPEIQMRDGAPRVRVSGEMRYLNCRLILAGFFRSRPDLMPESVFTTAMAPVRRCVAAGDDMLTCVDAALDRLWPAVSARMDTLEKMERTGIISLIDSAFLGLIIHEFGHYRLGHSAEIDDDDRLAQQEIDADIYALIAGSSLEYVGLAATYDFAFLGMAESELPAFDSPHASFSCRMMLSLKISSAVGFPARYITQLSQYEDPGFRNNVAGVSRGQTVYDATPAAECRARTAPNLSAMSNDLRQIAEVQAAFGKIDKATQTRPLIERLIALPLTTPLGKVIRSRVITNYAIAADWWMNAEQIAWLIGVLDPERNKASFLAQDYGKLIGMHAALIQNAGGAGHSPAELHRLFAVSRYYNPDFSLARAFEGDMLTKEGKCSESIVLLTPPPRTRIELGYDSLAGMGNRYRIQALSEAKEAQAGGKCP